MSDKKTLTFCLMDAPFENGRSTTALRLLHSAASKGHNVNVFAYEGAVGLTFTKQSGHPNKVHGHDAAEEDHPLTHEWIDSIAAIAKEKGGEFNWINCGLCVDERGTHEALAFAKRGTPGDLHNWTLSSDNTMVIPTR